MRFWSQSFPLSYDQLLQDYLTRRQVAWSLLESTQHRQFELEWRAIYGNYFLGRPRLRHGSRADYEYGKQSCSHYVIVPFTTKLLGTPVQADQQLMSAYECQGQLIPLNEFHNAEFFIVPANLSWTMVHTHEDHAFGGPYFVKREWIP